MAEKESKSVLVMPVNGKYCEVIYTTEGGATSSYKIWKVHPNTPDSLGTKIPYEVAVEFLGKTPAVITLVPTVNKGAFVSPLLEEDQKRIKESLERGFSGGRNYNAEPSVDSKDPDALVKVTKQLKDQAAENVELKTQLSNLLSRLEKLESVPVASK